jgi:hypothetical protein
VLIMNIDSSQHILSYDDIDAALGRYKPNVIIPGHYYTKGKNSVLTRLSIADEWVDRQKNISQLETSRLILNPLKVKQLKQQVYYFCMNYAKK